MEDQQDKIKQQLEAEDELIKIQQQYLELIDKFLGKLSQRLKYDDLLNISKYYNNHDLQQKYQQIQTNMENIDKNLNKDIEKFEESYKIITNFKKLIIDCLEKPQQIETHESPQSIEYILVRLNELIQNIFQQIGNILSKKNDSYFTMSSQNIVKIGKNILGVQNVYKKNQIQYVRDLVKFYESISIEWQQVITKINVNLEREEEIEYYREYKEDYQKNIKYIQDQLKQQKQY